MKNKKIGTIGLGRMGGGIAKNLIKKGFDVTGFDLNPSAMDKFIAIGGKKADNIDNIINDCDIIMTCLEGKTYIYVAEKILLPKANKGQVFIDNSTVPCPKTREIGQAFIQKDCSYLDAPVSGFSTGADAGTLRIFIGGAPEDVKENLSIFEAVGNPEKIVHCGSIGMGQAAKVVQQLTTRFTDVARMEVMTFGLRSGLELDILMKALDVNSNSDDPYSKLCSKIQNNNTKELSGIISEWPYYIEEIKSKGFRMPMLESMYEFCKDAEKR
ncbi:MAG TPA: NAD(P)-dependent oxidoreductase [Victivallales bacterium]|nr:NAD(P)-dependent oxidoreductase [Victivallales bacterium]